MYDFLPAIPSIQDDTFTQHVQQLLDHKTKPGARWAFWSAWRCAWRPSWARTSHCCRTRRW
jgi:hypothetical protein